MNSIFASGQLLAQSRPSGTSAVTVFTGPAARTDLTQVIITNTTGSAATFSLYHDDDGTTYDQTTALVYACSISGNTTVIIGSEGAGLGIQLSPGGSIGIQSGTSNACTFSIYGVTQS